MRHAVTKSRPKGMLETVSALVQLYPKTSAAIAFEVGVLASSLVNAARNRRGSLAKVVDVVPIPGTTQPHKRKTRKAKPAKARTRSAKSRPRKSATKPAADTAAQAGVA